MINELLGCRFLDSFENEAQMTLLVRIKNKLTLQQAKLVEIRSKSAKK
jgi:hypothetical protein